MEQDAVTWYVTIKEEKSFPPRLILSPDAKTEIKSGHWRVVELQLFDPETGLYSRCRHVEMHHTYDPGDVTVRLDELDLRGYLGRVVALMLSRVC